MRRKLIFLVPIGIAAIVLVAFIGGEVVKLLWNWLLPPLFGVREITYWQALGLLALCRILFGGCGLRGSSGSHGRRRLADRVADRVSERMAERWEHMTPEERERFRQGVRERWSFDPSATRARGNEMFISRSAVRQAPGSARFLATRPAAVRSSSRPARRSAPR